nr:MAG TPA: helix-turn-helix domain protein [Caudoviricetes sp.]
MTFGEKLRQLRKERGETQKEVAEAIGVTLRSYSSYELKNIQPRKRERLIKLADHFDVDVNYFYVDSEIFIGAAKDQYGLRGMRQAKALTNELAGMFAGGDLTDEDKDAVMQALQEAYWTAKKENRKYSSKR